MVSYHIVGVASTHTLKGERRRRVKKWERGRVEEMEREILVHIQIDELIKYV
jgi:hypothetical protein